MEEKLSTDFKFLIRLPPWKNELLKRELIKRKIMVKTSGTGNISGSAFGSSYSGLDIYVPENKLQESKEILAHFGWVENEMVYSKPNIWFRIYAFIIIIFLTIAFFYSLREFFK